MQQRERRTIMDVHFEYSPLSKSLEEQAKQQGLTLGKESGRLEKIRHAINMVGFHVATNSQVKSMTKKLHDKVMGAVEWLPEGERDEKV
jgi:hypothetical protein